MKIQITFDADAYRQAGATPAHITRTLWADLRGALQPIVSTLGQVLATGDRRVNDDFLETDVRHNQDNADGRDWRALYAAALRRPTPDAAPGWMPIYWALLDGQRLPYGVAQDDVIDAVTEIYHDVACGWMTPDHVRRKLPLIDKLCTLYGCLELYDQLVALLHDRTRSHDSPDERRCASPLSASERGRG